MSAAEIVSVELATRGGETVLAPGTPVSLSWRAAGHLRLRSGGMSAARTAHAPP